ncbi:MAG TPA: thermonuclease family protein, partial [Nitrospiria bacterium]|nr:thermonuclease family protein [Nitrospiria bacterium]
RPSPPCLFIFTLVIFQLFSYQLSSGTPRFLSTTVRVQEVIDGDTVILTDGEHLRYIGIDAPEIRRKVNGRWIYLPEPLAEEAKVHNERLVIGKTLTLEFDRERKDRYGRLLAYVYVNDLFINAELIREGYARLLVYPPNTRHADLFLRLEREAMREHRGIWNVKGTG